MTDGTDDLRERVIAALREVQDPEIPINLYDLGLIYELDVADDGTVAVAMTLTTPNCPVAETMPEMVRRAVAGVDGVTTATVELVWEPAWTRERMSEEAQAALEMMGIAWTDRGAPPTRTTSLTVGRKPSRGPKRD